MASPRDLYCRYLTAKRLREKPLPHAAKHVHFRLQVIVEEESFASKGLNSS
jgi:hypothetical protein